jgi:hypothetical protein
MTTNAMTLTLSLDLSLPLETIMESAQRQLAHAVGTYQRAEARERAHLLGLLRWYADRHCPTSWERLLGEGSV